MPRPPPLVRPPKWTYQPSYGLNSRVVNFESSIQRSPDSSLPGVYGASALAFSARWASSASRLEVCAAAGATARGDQDEREGGAPEGGAG